MSQAWVYIMANRRHNVLYVGMTSNIQRRVLEHKKGVYPQAFTLRYRCRELLWYQDVGGVSDALAMEKRVKRWRRPWKEKLIFRNEPGQVGPEL
jgi:putative endonuclease